LAAVFGPAAGIRSIASRASRIPCFAADEDYMTIKIKMRFEKQRLPGR
jgi:hypothetical protein